MPEADPIRSAVETALASINLALIGPEIILAVAGSLALVLAVMLGRERQYVVGYVSLFGVLGSLLFLVFQVRIVGASDGAASAPELGFAGLFVNDPFAVFFKYLFLIATGLIILISMRFLDEERAHAGEYYSLLCFATLGMMFMASGADLVTIYVGLELMALSIYVLVGFQKTSRRSNEAAMKYFILGAFSSAFFIYGISLFYGATGETSLRALGAAIGAHASNPLVMLALIMLSVGLGFKVAAVPFHAWAPDAYEGAPTPITAYVSVASKGAAFAILLRILVVGLYDLRESWTLLLWALAAVTMTYGNLVAIVQTNVKRMLAYSSIAHAGYVLLGVLAAGAAVPPGVAENASAFEEQLWLSELQSWSQGGVLLYLFAYTFMNIGAFGLVTMLRRQDVIGDEVKDFAGLYKRAPLAAIAMAVFLLSLGGIPPTAGFVGKLVLFGAVIKAEYYGLATIAVLNTAISVYFYFRIMVMMWMEEPPAEARPYALSPELVSAVAVAFFFTLLVGVWPGPFVRLAQASILDIGESLRAVAALR